MPREQCMVRVTLEEARSILELIGMSGSDRLDGFKRKLREDVIEDEGDDELIEKARKLYASRSDCDVMIDDDAPFSRTDDGAWVGAWVWVRYDKAEDDEEDKGEGEVP